MSAYVEMIFENSDRRFPLDADEVVLRRTIGQKKDEYSLNRKNTTKTEIMNILASAGFSRSNPFYIVPQGRVTALTNMKDAERLQLLKEVAGTQVYEERRAESLKIMEESKAKRAKIDELLGQVQTRLGELEEEKQELRTYQDKDRERRCLEYTIHHREQEALQEALEKLDELRVDGVEETDGNHSALEESEEQLEAIEGEISELQQQIKLLTDERVQLEEERRDTAREKAKAELDVNSLIEGQSAAQQARTRHANELRQVQDQIKQREQELAQIVPEYNAQKEQEKSMKQQLADAESTQQRLYAKQGRQSQFKTKKDRDAFLHREIDNVNMNLAQRKAVTMQNTEDIAELETEIGQLDAEVVDRRSQIDNRGDVQQSISSDVQKAKEDRDRLTDQRKELWREEARLDSIIENARTEMEKSERFLSTMMDRNTSSGLASVRRIVRQHNIQGAHGPLGELFEFSDKYKTAIEVTAGTSLFHYVVDNDETATQILEILNREKGGRLSFMPLNRLKSKPANIPNASDAVHLITKLRYNARYDAAFQHVFGKTVVCPNLQIAAQYARSHGISGITPEGDRSDKKGALTGGYHDHKHSRIDGMKRALQWRDAYETNMNRRLEIRDEQNSLDQQVTKAMSELQKTEQKRLQMESGYGPQREQLRSKENELQNKRDDLERLQRAREDVESDVRDLGGQQSGYEAELASDFKKALSADEEQQLEALSSSVQDMKKQYAALSNARSELQGRKSSIELELRENLRLTLDQLHSADAEAGASQGGGNANVRLKERQRELKRVTAALDSVTAKLMENESATEEARTQLQAKETDRAAVQKQAEALIKAIRNHAKSVEKAASKRAVLNERLTETAAHVRNLGVLPDIAFKPAYTDLPSDRALNRLGKVQQELKKYGHVNKKAFEQFSQFERQAELLANRRKELDTSDSKIMELIDVLDQRKDEAIQRTFKQVSREFTTIFERLVPAGMGRLVIQRRSDVQAGNQDEDDSDDERADGGVIESYTGVGISVSFNSKHDEQQRIQQLSGGQKSKPHTSLPPLLLIYFTDMYSRSLRPRPGLRYPSFGPRALLPLRRNRCQSRRAVPHRRCQPPAVVVRDGPIHLHNFQAGNAACGGEVLWRQLLA